MFGLGPSLLLWVRSFPAVLVAVALLALGLALVTPNLLMLIANRSGSSIGAGLGLQNTFGSLGQIVGPLVGVLLFSWRVDFPFMATTGGTLLLAAAIWGLERTASRHNHISGTTTSE